MINLPEGWTDFKIVETSDGVLTGQISIKDPKLFKKYTTEWEDTWRPILVEYTKQFIELKTGIKVIPFDKA